MFSIRVLFSDSYDPWFNLSVEEYIFRNMPEYQCILFLWRNQDTIVIGRAQNAWKECNTRRMERDGIRLARRSSGGGAVFHDLGNTCFTFMSKKSRMNEDDNFSINIILNGLKNLGVTAAFPSGRNDIVVHTNLGERKISGSAYRNTSVGKLHHGTLLLHADLNKLVYYLTPDEKKLEIKGITSVRSRIINLNELGHDINHKILCESLQESFFKICNQKVLPEIISFTSFSNNSDFSDLLFKQRSWEWNFGAVPNFSHHLSTRFIWGSVSLYFDIENGIINRSQIFTDSLYPEPLEELSYKIVNLPYNVRNVKFFCQKWVKKWYQYPELLEVKRWLLKNIS